MSLIGNKNQGQVQVSAPLFGAGLRLNFLLGSCFPSQMSNKLYFLTLQKILKSDFTFSHQIYNMKVFQTTAFFKPFTVFFCLNKFNAAVCTILSLVPFLTSKQYVLQIYFFCQITTFIKVRVAFVFRLQALQLKDFTKINQLKGLKPKNKGHTTAVLI